MQSYTNFVDNLYYAWNSIGRQFGNRKITFLVFVDILRILDPNHLRRARAMCVDTSLTECWRGWNEFWGMQKKKKTIGHPSGAVVDEDIYIYIYIQSSEVEWVRCSSVEEWVRVEWWFDIPRARFGQTAGNDIVRTEIEWKGYARLRQSRWFIIGIVTYQLSEWVVI